MDRINKVRYIIILKLFFLPFLLLHITCDASNTSNLGTELTWDFNSATATAINSAKEVNAPSKNALLELLKQINILEANLNSGAIQDTEALHQYLFYSEKAINKISNDISSNEASLIAKNLMEDILIKNDSANKKANLFFTAHSLQIKVNISTIKNGEKINGYSVAMIPVAYIEEPSKFPRLTTPTSNASASVLPGIYDIYLFKANEVVTHEIKQIKPDPSSSAKSLEVVIDVK